MPRRGAAGLARAPVVWIRWTLLPAVGAKKEPALVIEETAQARQAMARARAMAQNAMGLVPVLVAPLAGLVLAARAAPTSKVVVAVLVAER